MHRFEIKSSNQHQLINITQQVQEALRRLEIEQGTALVYVPHTTAGITINESADPSVEKDIIKDLKRLAPHSQNYYEHFEGNSAAHTMTSLVGTSVTVLVREGKLLMGRWQGIFLCEFDGPRTRNVIVSV